MADFVSKLLRMDRATLEALKLAARSATFEGEQFEVLTTIDRALAGELEPWIRAELHLTRAVALQIEDDASRSAADALAAIEISREGVAWDLQAAALAIGAGFVLRTGDLERSVDLAVEAMVLLAEHEQEHKNTDADFAVLRAANALSVVFSRLAAFSLAVDSAKTAWRAVPESDQTNVRAIVAYNLCSCGLARLRSDDLAPGEQTNLITDITMAIDYLSAEADSEQARVVVGPGMRAELALLGHADPAAIDALLDADVEALEIPPQVLAWHRLVRSIVARRNSDLELALELLDAALDVLRLPAAEEHNLLRAMRQRAEVRKLLGDADGAYEDLTALVERLHRAQVEQVGRMSSQIGRRADSEIARLKVRTEVAKEMSIDQVTGVGTRRWLERCMEELANSSGSGSVMMLDLDHFKTINDTFGHTAGDRVLARVGLVLKECLRNNDLIARYGGEEFVVFAPDAIIEVGHKLAERITIQLRKLDWSDIAPGMAVTISIGVTAGSFDHPWDLLEAADRALYEAKRAGRDRVMVADPAQPTID